MKSKVIYMEIKTEDTAKEEIEVTEVIEEEEAEVVRSINRSSNTNRRVTTMSSLIITSKEHKDKIA